MTVETGGVGNWWSQRPTWQKVLLIAGAALVLLVAGIAAFGSSDGAEDVAATTTTLSEETTTTTVGDTTTTTQAETTTTTDYPPMLGEGSGSGDDVVELSIIDTAAVVTFTHDGSGNFTVWDLGEGYEQTNLLVNTIGPYTGTRPLQWSEATLGFEITADGHWSYVIRPMWNSRHEECPFDGEGEDVLIINDYKEGGGPADITFDGDTNFVVWVYGFAAPELIVNEIGPYEGTVLVADKMITWDITGNGGTWTVDCG
jgi:hypothetical protein